MAERWCKRCEQTLPLAAFNKYKDGHQWWCRECFRKYFRERGDLHRREAGDALAARRERNQRHVLDYLWAHPCVACGEDDPIVLDFDHIGDDKECEISMLIRRGLSLEVIDAEITKCEVVCCNCHRIRTLEQKGCERGRQPAIEKQKPFVRDNLRLAYGLLEAGQCCDCGLRDSRLLDFDHVKGDKIAGVMWMAWNGYGRATILEEIKKCEIRCGICHRHRTAAQLNHFRYRASLERRASSLIG